MLIEITEGEAAFDSLAAELSLDDRGYLSRGNKETYTQIRKKLANILKNADPNTRFEFGLQMSHWANQDTREDLKNNWPDLEKVLAEFPNASQIHSRGEDKAREYIQKCQTTRRVGLYAVIGSSILGAVLGAIGSGELADKFVENQYLGYIATALGSFLSAGLGFGASIGPIGLIDDHFYRKIDQSREGAKMKFSNLVDDYISDDTAER